MIFAFSLFFFLILTPILILTVISADYSDKYVSSMEDLQPAEAIVVLASDGNVARLAREAADMYKLKKSGLILIAASGENKSSILRELASKLEQYEIASEFIIADYSSENVMQSCSHLRDEYKTSSAILLSPSNNLTQAMYLCHSAGLSVQGYLHADKETNTNVLASGLNILSAVWQAHTSPLR